MGAVDRRQRGAPIDRASQPALQWVRISTCPAFALRRQASAISRGAVLADGAVDRDILLGDLAGPSQGRGNRRLSGTSDNARRISRERPAQIDRGRAGRGEL